ncbi:MAG: hypothetical protein ABEI57_08505 [Halapricum sp.]
MDRTRLVRGGLLVAAIVLLPGMAKYVLTQQGYGTVGSMVWVGGYGLGVVLLWELWLRPLDITGPTDPSRPEE